MDSCTSILIFYPHHISDFAKSVLHYSSSSMLGRALPSARIHYPAVSLRQSNDLPTVQEYQPVVHRLRLYRPRLRSRLTLGGRAFPRKPQTFDGEDSHLTLATHASILSPVPSTAPYGTASASTRRSSTACICIQTHGFGGRFQPRTFSAHDHSTSELLRFP